MNHGSLQKIIRRFKEKAASCRRKEAEAWSRMDSAESCFYEGQAVAYEQVILKLEEES